VDAGAAWDVDNQIVLMGQALAPVLEDWSARLSAGSKGFTLTLHITGRAEPVEVFLRPAEAVGLSDFVDAANADGNRLPSLPDEDAQ
jgi:hypothetical protein